MPTVSQPDGQVIFEYFQREIINPRSANGSYLSWDHCYRYFQRENDFDADTAALHLGFFLASWGMYRASAKIRHYDYKTHRTAVDALRASPLFGVAHSRDFWNMDGFTADSIEKIFELFKTLCSKYQPLVGDTLELLVTKAMLGTLGCVPAYDRFVVDALKIQYLPQKFGQTQFAKIVVFCKRHWSELEKAQCLLLKHQDLDYPVMRIFDIYCHSISRSRKAEAGVLGSRG